MSEKATRPASGAGSQVAQPRAKKKSKILSFLCCGSQDEAGENGQELSEGPRQSAVASPEAVTNNPSAPVEPQSSTTQPEPAAETTNSVLDEKAPHPAYPETNTSRAPVEMATEAAPVTDISPTDKPVSNALTETVRPSTARETEAPTAVSSAGVIASSEPSRFEPPTKLDTSTSAAEGSSSYLGNPDVVVQAPTPIIQQDEDQLISDRTPEQEARDMDIEMTDVGPSLPLSANDVSGTSEDEGQAIVPHNESQHRIDLPPPPPLEERQAQVVHEPTSTGQGASLVPSLEQQKWLLPATRPEHRGRKCLVLDLDETLVHSSFKVRRMLRQTHDVCDMVTDDAQILHQADFTIPVEIEGQYHNVYVIKRPGVDQFMKRVGELYEVVVFTASVSKVGTKNGTDLRQKGQDTDMTQYGDPLLDQLDIHGVVHHRLFRESCYNHQGNYVKVEFFVIE